MKLLKLAWTGVTLLVLAGLSSCASEPTMEPGIAMPFTVRLQEVTFPNESEFARTDTITPAQYGDPREFTRSVAAALENAGVFTRVVTSSDEPADLEVQIRFLNHDFGEGVATLDGAVYSTLVWILMGHGSWWISNRRYPESNVEMRIESHILQPTVEEDSAGEPILPLTQRLLVKDLELSFYERAGPTDWFLNILMPPWLTDGDAEVRGKNLSNQLADFFTFQGTPQILSHLPFDYFEKMKCFLGYDNIDDVLVVVADHALDRATIRSTATGAERVVFVDEIEPVESVEDKAVILNWLNEGASGLSGEVSDHFYLIPLEENEIGYVNVELALIEWGPVSRWTVRRHAEPVVRR